MKKCWDASPDNRPDIESFIKELGDVITKHNKLQNCELRKLIACESSMHIPSIERKSSSIYNFKKLPEPRNATAEEIEDYHSNSMKVFEISYSDFI
ncbi:hypothetical protein C2G38_2057607 [Gigaspora rosea]|uniref:Serine-threonine/tyrosine-protein kinase catalytic domain-containing protein n=1 Tax=Gigaspora rosea TaxID=44941 RepID=A0A397W4T6_9GLOM|nr:hypothetical protein C2G38_2057607 [Gigaspora rosea]